MSLVQSEVEHPLPRRPRNCWNRHRSTMAASSSRPRQRWLRSRPRPPREESATARAEPSVASSERPSNAHDRQYPKNGEAAEKAMPEQAAVARDHSRLSPADQAMLAKIRGKVSADVPDETVAAAMLVAERNGILDLDSTGPVGVANGKLWVGAHIPGFHTGVSAIDPAPPMQHILRGMQSFNQQRELQLAQEAVQRGLDPSRGPRRSRAISQAVDWLLSPTPGAKPRILEAIARHAWNARPRSPGLPSRSASG